MNLSGCRLERTAVTVGGLSGPTAEPIIHNAASQHDCKPKTKPIAHQKRNCLTLQSFKNGHDYKKRATIKEFDAADYCGWNGNRYCCLESRFVSIYFSSHIVGGKDEMKRTGIRNMLGEKGHHKYYMDNKVNLLGIKTKEKRKNTSNKTS